ncbi:CHAT domain-containing protein [Jatrophihabitans sp.]|uniref:CHAT domain-containing protein n=1 Tax=Jatrophihabitans sp. TaxID=1932789 RepID=UPI0030C6CFC5|nr:hypothetical protein [Jatrophihabitans sp.]
MSGGLEDASALRARAVHEHDRGRPVRARRLLLRARERVGAPPYVDNGYADLAARIAISLARVDAELYGVEVGLTVAKQAAAEAWATGTPSLVVPAVGQVGLIALRAGRLGLAAESLESVEHMVDDGYGDVDDRYSVLLNLGTTRMLLGDLTRGRSSLVKAAELARSGRAFGEFMARHNLGYLDFLRGDIPSALEQMERALATNVDASIGVALLDRARVLFEAGLVRGADTALAEAAKIFAADRLAQDLGEAELERARCALISADIGAARRFAGRARTRFARRGSDRWRQAAELVLLQADLAAGRPGRRLIGPARRLRDELAAEGLGVLARTATLIAAEAALAAGDSADAAIELLQLGRETRRDPITYRLHAAYVRARLDAAQGRRGPAAARLRRGLSELAAYQSGFGSLDLSTAAAVHGSRLVALDVELALVTGRAASVFAAAERGRAVTSRLAPVRPPDDQVTAELLAELRQTVESLRGVELDPGQAAPLARRRSELERRIAERAWSRQGGRSVDEAVPLSVLRPALGSADSTLVSYVVSGTELHAVLVGESRVRHVRLGPFAAVGEQVRRVRADLDILAQPRLPAAIGSAVRASFGRSIQALDAALIAPLRLQGRLVLVTTGLLGAVPWGALPSLRGVPLVVAPSATAWVTATRLPRRSGGRRMVAVAGPGLARSDDEAADAAAAWGTGKVIAGATGAAVSQAMATARVVHIAAHGVHQNENPLFSSIRLADGPLFAHELDQTAGTPEHVVLSACELGLATVRPGDEALGLTSVLLRLGTKSVVSGVARIGDDLAADVMGTYHRLLAGGRDSAAALAEAGEAVGQPVPLVCFGATWALRG